MSRYNVIWIDDEWEKMSSFIQVCKLIHNIELTPFKTSKKGMEALENDLPHWDAIILDAKVFDETENEVAKLTGLRKSIDKIKSLEYKRAIPYFISTGQPDLLSNEIFSETFGKFYIKETDDEALIRDVIIAADKQVETHTRKKYCDVLCLYEDIESELLNILIGIENNDSDNPSYLNDIRKILEWIRGEFLSRSLIPTTVTDLNGFSHYVCDNVAPTSIQRSIHAAIVVSQEGSHRLTINEEIKSGLAPYLIRSTVFELLNVLIWCKRLFVDEEQMRIIREKAIKESSSCFEGLVDKDSNGFYYCGDYCLNPIYAESVMGCTIKITKYSTNTNPKTKAYYKYYANKFELSERCVAITHNK